MWRQQQQPQQQQQIDRPLKASLTTDANPTYILPRCRHYTQVYIGGIGGWDVSWVSVVAHFVASTETWNYNNIKCNEFVLIHSFVLMREIGTVFDWRCSGPSWLALQLIMPGTGLGDMYVCVGAEGRRNTFIFVPYTTAVALYCCCCCVTPFLMNLQALSL